MPVAHLHVLHVAQYDLCVEHIGQFAHHLTLDGKLLVEQGQVILQLSVGRDQDSLSLGVILRTTGSAKHLESDAIELVYSLQSS